jgi:hypothetical protein
MILLLLNLKTVSTQVQFSPQRGSSLRMYFCRAASVGRKFFVIWETMNLQAQSNFRDITRGIFYMRLLLVGGAARYLDRRDCR